MVVGGMHGWGGLCGCREGVVVGACMVGGTCMVAGVACVAAGGHVWLPGYG